MFVVLSLWLTSLYMQDFQNITTFVVSYVQSWLKYQNKALIQLCVDVSKPETVPKLNFDWLLLQENVKRGCPTANQSASYESRSHALQFSKHGRKLRQKAQYFTADSFYQYLSLLMMGQPRKTRADRPKKRGWNGNQHTGPAKKKKVVENKSPIDNEASTSTIDASDESVNIPSKLPPSVSPDPKSVDFNTASGQKLKNNVQGDIVFDKEELLTGFRFVDIKLLIDFVQTLLCPTCKRPLGQNSRQSHSHVKEHRTNQASKLVFTCQCKDKSVLFTSKKCGRVYEANRRFPLAMFSIGKHHTGAKRFLGNMNMPPPPHRQSWRNHKKQIEKATKLVASASMQEAAQEMKTTDPHTDIQVSCDGTWHRRGFSSKNGIVTLLSVNGRNSKVIDTETLANHCDACAKHKHKKGEAEFEQWHKTHTQKKLCEKNHTGSAGSMEPAGTETIFRRSVTKHGLRYMQYLGDGDSKSYSRVKNAQPPVYDNTDITKLECCGHVQKRMGRHLTNKVSELKKTPFVHNGKNVKGIGGRGGLKKTAILMIVKTCCLMSQSNVKICCLMFQSNVKTCCLMSWPIFKTCCLMS